MRAKHKGRAVNYYVVSIGDDAFEKRTLAEAKEAARYLIFDGGVFTAWGETTADAAWVYPSYQDDLDDYANYIFAIVRAADGTVVESRNEKEAKRMVDLVMRLPRT